MLKLVARYRRNAEECRNVAKQAKSRAIRFRYELLAKNWEELAVKREKFLKRLQGRDQSRSTE